MFDLSDVHDWLSKLLFFKRIETMLCLGGARSNQSVDHIRFLIIVFCVIVHL